ncbi:MAG TPA: YkvA family protein [Ignavibacteria bacterium]
MNYSNYYSENKFWKKIKTVGRSIPFSRDVIALFYCLCDPNTPKWVKVIIIFALGYFICPLDAVPDLIPIGGYGDDAGVIASALASISQFVRKEHYKKADEFLS